jgi:SAM-dependent methyltransferase
MALIEEFVAGRVPPALYQAYLTPLFETWSDVLVSELPPKGRVLDIACGTGIVTRKIAGQPGVETVVGIDIASPMVDAARATTPQNALIAFATASADDIDQPDGSFDAAFCQQGLQFFPDRLAALNEAARLLKPGANAAFAVWTSGNDGNPVFGAFEDVVAEELGEDLIPFGPFSFGDRSAIEQLVSNSGLNLVSLTREERHTRLPDPRTLVLFDLLFLGRPGPDGSMHPLFDPSDGSKDEQIETIIAKLTERTSEYHQTEGTLLAPSAAHIVILSNG